MALETAAEELLEVVTNEFLTELSILTEHMKGDSIELDIDHIYERLETFYEVFKGDDADDFNANIFHELVAVLKRKRPDIFTDGNTIYLRFAGQPTEEPGERTPMCEMCLVTHSTVCHYNVFVCRACRDMIEDAKTS